MTNGKASRSPLPPNVRRAELRRLFAHRRVPPLEANAAIATLGNLASYSQRELGEAVKLKLAERADLIIRTIACADRTPAEVEAFYKERKRKRDVATAPERRERAKKRRQLDRARLNRSRDLDVREEALFSIIGDIVSVPDLIALCTKQQCWCGPDGRPLTGDSLSSVVRRELDKLKAQGRIADELRPGRRGAVRWCWRTRKIAAVASLKIAR